MTVLYNCKYDGDIYRITKWINGNPEASYLCDLDACDCPAGVRPTCRHRQMLPAFINMNTVNTEWFMDFDGDRRFVNMQGLALPDDLPLAPEGLHGTAVEDTPSIPATRWRRM